MLVSDPMTNEPRTHERSLEDVAIGDTFAKVLPPLFPGLEPTVGEPWEVTEYQPVEGVPRWRLMRGGEAIGRSSEGLLDPARWRRVRAC